MMPAMIGFTTPWLLVALAALPILWILLRAVPPAPIRRRFPGVALLLGLGDDDAVSARTPWWLLLLRMLAVAALIVGLAGPVLNPEPRQNGAVAKGSLLIVLDGSWAAARDWPAQKALIDAMLAEAQRKARPVALLRLSAPKPPVFRTAEAWRSRLSGLAPAPWSPSADDMKAAASMLGGHDFETRWFSDGLAREGRQTLLRALQAHGAVSVHESPAPIIALRPVTLAGEELQLSAIRARPGPARQITIEAHGHDPSGAPSILARTRLTFDTGETEARGAMTLPAELRARLSRFVIAGQDHAGAVTLSADNLRRREVALIAARADREAPDLISPLYYLRKALVPAADILDGSLSEVLPANPDVIVLADVATLSPAEQAAVMEWTKKGGLLLRFAGPRLAASDISRRKEAPLMPVRLRSGGRTLGGAMSWGTPKALAPFPEGSPFFGLKIPADVRVSAQVLAQPDPTLAERVIAQLSDGTPLVTRKHIGAGQVVLFHVTANAEWSSLPLSGLFVQMLERLAVSSSVVPPELAEMKGTTWRPVRVLDGFGQLHDAGTLPGVDGQKLIGEPPGPGLPAGLYEGPDRRLALNVIAAGTALAPSVWPADVAVTGLERAREIPLGGWCLAFALALLSVDIVAALALSGRLWLLRAAALVIAALALPAEGEAQAPDKAMRAASGVTLAHVLTGDDKVDRVAQAGLRGLGQALTFRTSVEPADPVGVDIESDELAVYPLLYWPVTPDQPIPSDAAYARLSEYLRTGGMIVFDTRDSDVAGFGTASPNGRKLRRLARPLDIPPLEPIPKDHVLTRTFYLLQDFPGRHTGRPVWVEAAPADAKRAEGMPFRDLNDNVSPVVIGGNDWAGAWAVDESGNPMFPVGRGYGGERQREIAYRFGVNLVM